MTKKIEPIVPASAGEEILVSPANKGNKNKQIVAAKRWCFTLCNYTESDEEEIINKFRANSANYIIGREVCPSTGTPHLQGYVEFSKRLRPLSLKFSCKPHFEKCKGNREENLKYCSKECNYKTNFKMDKPLKLLTEDKLFYWQKDILNIIKTEPDDRTINWYWEPRGKVGKSIFSKYLCAKHNAMIVEGKSADIYQGIAGYKKTEGCFPEIVIIDCPRENFEYINYGAIEKVKNGHIFSGKYESQQYLFNSPHVIVFANEKPNINAMSADRWNIVRIKPEGAPPGAEA